MTTQPPSVPAPTTTSSRSTTSSPTRRWSPSSDADARSRRSPVRLLAIVIVGGAFLGGILVQKSQTKTSAASALPTGSPASIAARFGGGTSTTVAGAGSGATRRPTSTFGTIKLR